MNKILMFPVNWFKVGLAWLVDAINWLLEPFQEFTRPDELKYPEALIQKEAKFWSDMERFWWAARKIYLYTLPTNSGDQCLWQGVYTAMVSLKYAATNDENVLARLHDCGLGLMQHQIPYGNGEQRLIRGWRSDGTYEDSVSNDQASGHILGIYFLWKYGDIQSRNMARRLIVGLADELLAHGNCLINADGTPTEYGNLVDGYLADPLNLTLCLATHKLASAMTSDPKYEAAYNAVLSLYQPITPYANLRLLWWKQDTYPLRAAIHYTILCDLEKDHDTQRKYLAGLLRTWRMERKVANPFVYFCMRRICLYDPAYEDRVKRHLREMTLEDKNGDVQRMNSNTVPWFWWGAYKRAFQPIPRWKIGAQDYLDGRNFSSVDDWIGNTVSDTHYNGGDFLFAYWGFRILGIIKRDE